MIGIRGQSSLLNIIPRDQPALPDLQALIARWHDRRIRRIDRYIQLCLAGALECVAGRALPADTGLYLATRCGAVATPAQVMSTIARDRDPPGPLQFVNTLGNTAGFYLTQLLGLTGNTLVISGEQLSFEAALMHAWLDLSQGRVRSALVGGFDEVPQPQEQQLRRLEAAANTAALAEGSHWLLLETRGAAPRLQMPEYFRDFDQCIRSPASRGHPLQLCFAPTAAERQALRRADIEYSEFSIDALPHGVFSGAALLHLVSAGSSGIHLARNEDGGYCAVRVGA